MKKEVLETLKYNPSRCLYPVSCYINVNKTRKKILDRVFGRNYLIFGIFVRFTFLRNAIKQVFSLQFIVALSPHSM